MSAWAPGRPSAGDGRGWVVAVVMVVAASCGHSPAATTVPTTMVPATSSSTTTTLTAAACSFRGDLVNSAADLVQLQARGATQLVGLTGAKMPLGCGTVRASGGGAANVLFAPRVADCQFQEDPASTKVAVMRTREPDGTLLRLAVGQVSCTTAKPGQLLALCGLGDIQPDGQVNRLIATCNPDPDFSVIVVSGRAQVTDPSGKLFEMGPGDQYDYNFADPSSSSISPAQVTRSEVATFVAQARALDVAIDIPTTTTGTTRPIP